MKIHLSRKGKEHKWEVRQGNGGNHVVYHIKNVLKTLQLMNFLNGKATLSIPIHLKKTYLPQIKKIIINEASKRTWMEWMMVERNQ